jgi:hypothetical protein
LSEARYKQLLRDGYRACMYGEYDFKNLDGEEYEIWKEGYEDAQYELDIWRQLNHD